MSAITSCGGNKTTNSESDASKTTTRVYSPMDLYFMRPLAMLVSPQGGDNSTAYLPDFVDYPNDIVKLGLRGPVKECVAGISTIRYTYKFNIDGKLTNYQFRMDSQGSFGEGARMKYDESGNLIFLGRDFRRQSPNSHTYTYSNGKLTKRQYGSAYRDYTWTEDKDGSIRPKSVENHGLNPSLEIKYGQNADGLPIICEMSYNNPEIPGSMTAKTGTSTFEYAPNGQLLKVKTAYQGCSNPQYKELWGICEYTYNEHGDVVSLENTLYDSPAEGHKQLLSVINTYTYTYDGQGNWISVTMDSSDKQSVGLNTLNRTITYYSEAEIAEREKARKAFLEHPLIGQWRLSNKEEFETDYGERETVEETATLVINLYDKFTPDGYTEPKYGIIFVESNPSLGMEQTGSWDITDAKINGNSVDIKLMGFNSADEYSATLKFNPKTKSIKFENLRLTKKAPEVSSDEASDFEYFDLEPYEGEYVFLKRATSNQ